MSLPERDGADELLWLIRLRWLTLAAQCVAVATAAWIGEHVGLAGPLIVLAVVAASNLALMAIRRGAPDFAALGPVLLGDTVLLTVLLHLTGGPMNPFSVLYLVHITLASVLLGPAWVWTLVTVALACFGLLFVGQPPMAHAHGMMGQHLRGMWLAFGVASVLIATFIGRLTRELARRDRALVVARERLARTERVAALTSLAAGAAHELGTPIGSIALAAEALSHALADAEGEVLDDVKLIRGEVKRCRTILDGLSRSAGELPGEGFAPVTLRGMADAVLARLEPADVPRVDVRVDDGEVTVPLEALSLAVTNLVKNALEAGPGPVVLALADDGELRVEVRDEGEGMPKDVLARAKEPFYGHKARGLGLGLFLVQAFAEQLGGRFELSSTPGAGTEARLTLPSRREHPR